MPLAGAPSTARRLSRGTRISQRSARAAQDVVVRDSPTSDLFTTLETVENIGPMRVRESGPITSDAASRLIVRSDAEVSARSRSQPDVRGRLLLLAGAGVCLLLGLDAGLLLLGLPAPFTAERLLDLHASLMIIGFLGTLIALERAIALRRWWGYLAPVAVAVGSLSLLSRLPLQVGHTLQLLGLGVLVMVYRSLWRRSASTAVAIEAIGAVLATGAVAMWIGSVATPALFPWLAGFLILTIVGERLELASVGAPPPIAEQGLLVLAVSYAVSAAATLLWPVAGTVALGAVTLAIVVWLVRFDVARRTLRLTGLPRYVAVNLTFGTAWLAVAGSVWLLWGPVADDAGYDVVVHAVGVGFALSMVLAHAPIIGPAVIRRPLPYHPVLYVATGGLQLALLLRVAGDIRAATGLWQVGGAAGAAVILAFAVMTVTLVVRR